MHPLSPTPVEAALRRNDREQVAVFLLMVQHFGFHMPTTAFANQCHSDQFTVTALGLWPWSADCASDFLKNVIYDRVHPQAKIIKVVYH
jgi:hypothetical protein